MKNKYQREIKPGVWVDVYDVLKAFNVTCPAVAHAVKKALAPGQRGHKDTAQDMREVIQSMERAIELHHEDLAPEEGRPIVMAPALGEQYTGGGGSGAGDRQVGMSPTLGAPFNKDDEALEGLERTRPPYGDLAERLRCSDLAEQATESLPGRRTQR